MILTFAQTIAFVVSSLKEPKPVREYPQPVQAGAEQRRASAIHSIGFSYLVTLLRGNRSRHHP